MTRSLRVMQKALAVSLPAHGYPAGSFDKVACPSLGRCVASFGGPLVLSERGGKWRRDAVPSSVFLNSLACPTPGSCASTARARGSLSVFVVTKNGQSWRKSVVELPGNLDPSKAYPVLPSVSCGSPGNCSAVGSYQTFKPGEIRTHALLVDEKNGAWSAGFDAQLPPDAATAPDVNGQGPGGEASVVSCPSAGNCAAVGSYDVLVGDLNLSAGWVATEQAGHWAPAVRVQLRGKPLAAEHLAFTAVSCPSVRNCTAVGGSGAPGGGGKGLILQERKGVWLQAIRAPLPRGGEVPSAPNSFEIPLFSVSCGAADDCGAVGAYVKKGHKSSPGTYHGWLLAERHGKWSASALVLPRNAKGAGMVFLHQVDCPARGTCVAVGSYNRHGTGQPLLVIERGGKWQRAVNVALPSDAAEPARRHAGLESVSCASANRCTIVGTYNSKARKVRGLILSLRLR